MTFHIIVGNFANWHHCEVRSPLMKSLWISRGLSLGMCNSWSLSVSVMHVAAKYIQLAKPMLPNLDFHALLYCRPVFQLPLREEVKLMLDNTNNERKDSTKMSSICECERFTADQEKARDWKTCLRVWCYDFSALLFLKSTSWAIV